MLDRLSLDDLFLVGLALDIVGATLLALGLMLSAEMIYKVSATYVGANWSDLKDRCRNRVLAEFGLAYLAAGFVFQTVGYLLEIGGVRSESGIGRMVAAICIAVVAAASAILLWAALRNRRIKHFMDGATAASEKAEAEEAARLRAAR